IRTIAERRSTPKRFPPYWPEVVHPPQSAEDGCHKAHETRTKTDTECSRLADVDTPNLRSGLEILPSKFAFVLRCKLIVKRFGIVIVHECKLLPRTECFVRRKDQFMPARRSKA